MYPDSHKWKFPIKTIWDDEKEIEDDDGDTSFTQTTTRRTQKDHRRRIWCCYWSCYGYLECGQEELWGLTPIWVWILLNIQNEFGETEVHDAKKKIFFL